LTQMKSSSFHCAVVKEQTFPSGD